MSSALHVVLLRQILRLLNGSFVPIKMVQILVFYPFDHRHLRVVPQNDVSARLGHGLCHSQPNPIGSTGDNHDLSGHTELLKAIGGSVWERAWESSPSLCAVLN